MTSAKKSKTKAKAKSGSIKEKRGSTKRGSAKSGGGVIERGEPRKLQLPGAEGPVSDIEKGPEREFRGDERESVIDLNRSRASDLRENDLGELAGADNKPSPDAAPERAPASPAGGAADRNSA